MKTVVLLILFYLYGYQADVYYVTFVKGDVKLESSGKSIKTGDKIKGIDKLIFKDQNSKISCISPSRGRFDITPAATKANAKGEWLAIISAKLVPSPSQQRLSSRSLGAEAGYDPVSYFTSQNDRPIVLLNGMALPVIASYKLDAGNFFFVQYEFQGKNRVRKIPHQNQSLIFSTELFTDNEGKPISADMLNKVLLCYQSLENSVPRSKALLTFTPLLLDKDELGKEIGTLYTYLKPFKKDNIKEIHSEILAHLTDNYGKVNADEMEKQFLENLK